MHFGSAYDRRVKLVSDNAVRLLHLHASEDDTGVKREFLRFNLGSGLSWLDDDSTVSQASSKDGEVVVLYKGQFQVPPVHAVESAHDAFVRCVTTCTCSSIFFCFLFYVFCFFQNDEKYIIQIELIVLK